MPSAEAILAGLTRIANEWRALAVFWHGFAAAVLLMIAVRRDLSNRLVGALLALPVLSVSALGWISHNPFNGAAFAALAAALGTVAYRLPADPVRNASGPSILAGVVFVAFGWFYPHFLENTHWSAYLIATPLGLLPCPTLSALIGFTLMREGLASTPWSATLAGTAMLYAAIGIFRLGVTIDAVLFAGAAMLIAARVSQRGSNHGLLRRSGTRDAV